MPTAGSGPETESQEEMLTRLLAENVMLKNCNGQLNAMLDRANEQLKIYEAGTTVT